MIYNILTEPNPILHQPAKPMSQDDILKKETQQFIGDMIETMYAKDGVGLAAPQVGQSIRLLVIVKEHNTLNPNKDLCLINPKWTKLSRFGHWDEEGCLSVPEIYGQVKRYKKIKVTALDEAGQPVEFIAKDFFARIIQHEVDHLDGILFIEKAKDLRRYDKTNL